MVTRHTYIYIYIYISKGVGGKLAVVVGVGSLGGGDFGRGSVRVFDDLISRKGVTNGRTIP